MTSAQIHVAAFAELTPAVLHGILRLRQEVFVVEQACPYRDIDGRDAVCGGTLRCALAAVA